MKLSLLPALTLCCFAASAQTAAKPKQRDNVVLVQTPDSAATALKNIAQAFVSQGYTIDKFDSQFLTFTLAPKTLATAFAPVLLVHGSASKGANSTIRLAGEYRAMVMGRPINGPAEMQGNEKGVAISGFRALEKAALAYPGGQVSYTKE